MSEVFQRGPYTATLLDEEGDVSEHIDIRPPFDAIASKAHLRFCGELCGTTLEPYASTPNTTRLGVTINDEELDDDARHAAFTNTAKVIARTLALIDQGENVTYMGLEDLLQ